MSLDHRYDWRYFYQDFAEKLLPYRENQMELILGIRQAFEIAGIKVPTLDKDETIEHMDPFTVMGFFNKTGMKDEKRLSIINALREVFKISTPPPTSFDGVPLLNPLNATYYPFGRIDDAGMFQKLWELMDVALQYRKHQEQQLKKKLTELIDYAVNLKYNGKSKISIALFWIAPDFYLNLDSRNEWYIFDSGKVPSEKIQGLPHPANDPLSGVDYFTIMEGIRKILPDLGFTSLIALSEEAWRYSEEINKRNAAEKKKKKAEGNGTTKENVGAGLADENVRTVRYWLYSPGNYACKWDDFYEAGIMAIGWPETGDLTQYQSREEVRAALKEANNSDKTYKMSSLAVWQFMADIQPGDIVYAKQGAEWLVGRGIVEGDYAYDPEGDPEYPHVRKVKWTHNEKKPHPGYAAQKTLTDITAYTEYVQKLEAIFENADEEETEELPEVEYPDYTKEDFLREVYMDEDEFNTIVRQLNKKKNLILCGAPGVGKTYTAKRLAYALMGEKNQERVQMIQFHQSYSYEDFIEGFRPGSDGKDFVIKKGSFYRFCKMAEVDLDHDYYYIIDEINRGNISRIFGELFMLVEADKRGNALHLLYSDELFSVPANVYVIGTMNTADRSLAFMDFALFRRFSHYDMKPGFESEGFRKYQKDLNQPKFDKLIAEIKALNQTIAIDEGLGDGFCIGHSYFSNLESPGDTELVDIIQYEIAPLLKEYWYDEKKKAEDAIAGLKETIK